ncbi:MAG: tRNA lysidine(34) synthetase TilS, partial [Eubacterium sp.]|nr:tRNA lysidine(34) synthetase TilS [Eubacterium sp.]
EIPVSGEGQFILNHMAFHVRISDAEGMDFDYTGIPVKTYTKWLDCDKMKRNIVLRTRRAGDYLVINGQGGRKKLKAFLIDEKVPAEMRDRIVVLASGSEVYWVVGYRISESVKVSAETRHIMEIRAEAF